MEGCEALVSLPKLARPHDSSIALFGDPWIARQCQQFRNRQGLARPAGQRLPNLPAPSAPFYTQGAARPSDVAPAPYLQLSASSCHFRQKHLGGDEGGMRSLARLLGDPSGKTSIPLEHLFIEPS